MSIPDLRNALNEGVVHFEFIKKDGTLRHARGTTSPDLVPA
ncbi:MAG: SH3 beta-barrel fold-containing protein, partial [Paludibacteraceae bacterium]|nr:SH3 beta-barrel fold-containing protein [Paludibacteraceae bacterium]MCR5532408.1 SH3 beta-barrel fold-containing protein [Paludibacteraceae bacterium]